jgi:hypothetical protein
VIVVDQQTWMTLFGMAGFTLTLFGYLRAIKADLKAEITGMETRLTGRIDRLEVRVDDGFDRVDAHLSVLEQRTYDLAVRLPAPPVTQRAE